jgi:hypothetical protein
MNGTYLEAPQQESSALEYIILKLRPTLKQVLELQP